MTRSTTARPCPAGADPAAAVAFRVAVVVAAFHVVVMVGVVPLVYFLGFNLPERLPCVILYAVGRGKTPKRRRLHADPARDADAWRDAPERDAGPLGGQLAPSGLCRPAFALSRLGTFGNELHESAAPIC